MRQLRYSEALSEATIQAMEEIPNLFVMGEGVDDPKGAFGTTREAFLRFGANRVFDTPLSEAAMTGIGIGAAISGHPCIMVHMRMEFLLYAADQIINHAAKWHYMFGGQASVPIVIRCLIGRGWGQAAQHSQNLMGLFAGVPGLKIVAPATPRDAKELLLASIKDANPVLFVEHRWLYDKTETLPTQTKVATLGKADIIKDGKQVSIVAYSLSVYEAIEASAMLSDEGIDAEIINLRSIRPLDILTIEKSAQKTGRLLILEGASTQFGVSAEIAAQISDRLFSRLECPVQRLGLPEAPTPCSSHLEENYYVTPNKIVSVVRAMLGVNQNISNTKFSENSRDPSFTGPF